VRRSIAIYDSTEDRFIEGEFRSVREMDSGAQLGYFESTEYATKLAIVVLYPDSTYSIAEWLDDVLAQGRIGYDLGSLPSRVAGSRTG